MTIDKYLDSKLIKADEVRQNFKLLEIIDVKEDKKGCYKCQSYVNPLPTEPWCGAYCCNLCNTLTMIYYQDMMGGGSIIYTLEIYKDFKK